MLHLSLASAEPIADPLVPCESYNLGEVTRFLRRSNIPPYTSGSSDNPYRVRGRRFNGLAPERFPLFQYLGCVFVYCT